MSCSTTETVEKSLRIQTFNSTCPFHKRSCKCSRRLVPSKTPRLQGETTGGQELSGVPGGSSSLPLQDCENKLHLDTRPASTRAPILPRSIRNPEAVRRQLWMGFLGYHLPQDLPQIDLLNEKYDRWIEPHCRSLRLAIYSCIMLHYASIANDAQAEAAGAQSHVWAVQHLRDELDRLSSANSDAVLCTISALAMCCRLRRFDDADEVHHDGLMAILRERGPAIVQSEFVRDIIPNLLPRALTVAVKTKRELLFGKPEWQNALAAHCEDNQIKQIVLTSCRIPNVLGALEARLHKGPQTLGLELAYLLRETSEIESSLKDILDQWYDEVGGQPYCTVLTKCRFPQFAQRTKLWSSQTVFTSAYDFRTPLDAVWHNWYWVALMGTYNTMLRMLEVLPPYCCVDPNIAPADRRQTIIDQCTKLAGNICRSVPFVCSEPAARRFRSSLWSQVCTARQWYERAGLENEAIWCHNLLDELSQEDDEANVVRDTASIDQLFAGWMMLL